MTPPIEINGQEVSGMTLNGNEIDTVQVNGQEVFTGVELPVAYSNMIAWYPMERNISGGDEFSDATAIISGAADSTAYDLVDDGAVYRPSGGVTDINQGTASGAFENETGDQYLTSNVPVNLPITISFWYIRESGSYPFGTYSDTDYLYYNASGPGWNFPSGGNLNGNEAPTGEYLHTALSIDASGNATAVFNRDTTDTSTVNSLGNNQIEILSIGNEGSNTMQGYMEDVRFYNTDLSVSQIQDIFDNTSP